MTAARTQIPTDGIPIRVRCSAFGFAGGTLPRDPESRMLTINTLVVLPTGAEIRVTLRDAATAKLVRAAGRVERQLVEDDCRVGMVVELTSFDGEGAEVLRDIIVAALDETAATPKPIEIGTMLRDPNDLRGHEATAELFPTPIPLPEDAVRPAPPARIAPVPLPGTEMSQVPVAPEPEVARPTAPARRLEARPVATDRSSMPERKPYEGLVPYGLTLLVETDRLGPVTGVLAADAPDGGLFVESEHALAVGSALLVSLPDPQTGQPVRTVCKVVRHVLGHGGDMLGSQLAFSTTDPALPEALAALLQAADVSRQVVDRTPDAPAADGEEEIDVDIDLRERTRNLVGNALTEARAGRPAQAIDLLLKALAHEPQDAAEIHLRIAHIALDDLSDVDFARYHVREAERLSPERADLRGILREIGARVGHRPRARVPSERRTKRRVRLTWPGRRLLAIVVFTIAMATGIGTWLTWRYVLPRGGAPEIVAVGEVDDLVPASAVRLYRRRLYVRVEPKWLGEPQHVRRRAIEDLARRARLRFDAPVVLLTDAENHLVATYVGGRVTIAR